MEQKWQHSWKSFVLEVARLVDAGCDAQELTLRFQNKPVQWSGRLHEKLDDPISGVQLFLPEARVQMKNGAILEANFLFAKFRGKDAKFWKEVEKGSTLEFITEIEPGVDPFYGIRILDLGEDVSAILVGACGIRPVIGQGK